MPKPRIILDGDLIRALAQIHCTVQEIATALKVSKDTLERNYMEDIETGRAEGRASLRRMQFELAKTGNATMQIWLGKQVLGQRDFRLEQISDELLTAEVERRMKQREKSGK